MYLLFIFLDFYFFFFTDPATTDIYTLSLHDALPIWLARRGRPRAGRVPAAPSWLRGGRWRAREDGRRLGCRPRPRARGLGSDLRRAAAAGCPPPHGCPPGAARDHEARGAPGGARRRGPRWHRGRTRRRRDPERDRRRWPERDHGRRSS